MERNGIFAFPIPCEFNQFGYLFTARCDEVPTRIGSVVELQSQYAAVSYVRPIQLVAMAENRNNVSNVRLLEDLSEMHVGGEDDRRHIPWLHTRGIRV